MKKLPSNEEINTFVAILQYFNMFQPEEQYKILCPFHADKNASLQINVRNAFFYCYADCGAKGGALELYKLQMKLQGKSVNDLQALSAIKHIISRQSSKRHSALYTTTITTTIANTDFVDNESINRKLSYAEAIQQAKNFYYNLPEPNWYRPSSVESIEEETRLCKNYMLSRGYTSLLLTNSDAKPSLNKYYPLVLPIYENSLFRGYVMRTFDPDIEAERKYMYNRGFKRERVLAGQFKNETVLLVEGYLDKLKANQLGIKFSVAILGWKLTPTQATKLQKANVKKIICATDNDEAGQKGYRYLKRIAASYGFKVVKLRYPKGIKDFGDLQKATPQATSVLNQIKQHGGT